MTETKRKMQNQKATIWSDIETRMSITKQETSIDRYDKPIQKKKDRVFFESSYLKGLSLRAHRSHGGGSAESAERAYGAKATTEQITHCCA